jgi:multiple sugar transport system substrate-binding protein
MIELRGITWGHSRGYLPMVATAQRFEEEHPGVRIEWRKRSLQEFAAQPVEKLAEYYDLLVIDHPFCGYAAAHDVLLPLDSFLPADFLADQAANSVGPSHASYFFGGHQWALAIDAAAPVSAYRPDLLDRAGVELPRTWAELLALARRGLVAVPAIPIDSLMHFYMLCIASGEEPFQSAGRVAGEAAGVRALSMLRELVATCGPECLQRNPIATWDLLARSTSVAYCPFAYGYSNYARPGYGAHALEFSDLVRTDAGEALRSTLGGAGLAVSSRCRHPDETMAYCRYVAGAACQKTVYFDSGGQPGHRQAWLDAEVNRRSSNFFRNTLPALDRAYLRPRFDGYLHFQDAAGSVVHRYLSGSGGAEDTLDELDSLWRMHEAVERPADRGF